jgi:hypothetical protein
MRAVCHFFSTFDQGEPEPDTGYFTFLSEAF